jgi:hypothetical protein
MNTTRYASTYAQPAPPVLGGSRRNVTLTLTPPPAPRRPAVQQRPAVQTVERVTVHGVRDLIEAAGPLSLRDIAGALDVPERDAMVVVGWMIARDCLRQDEWGRHRLWGACRN